MVFYTHAMLTLRFLEHDLMLNATGNGHLFITKAEDDCQEVYAADGCLGVTHAEMLAF